MARNASTPLCAAASASKVFTLHHFASDRIAHASLAVPGSAHRPDRIYSYRIAPHRIEAPLDRDLVGRSEIGK